MAHDCTLTILMKIKAPLLCAATGVSAWGYDKTFHRNERGEPAILKSHVKGKLREAWRELGFGDDFIGKWLGREEKKDLADVKGKLIFSDLVLQGKASHPTKHHRIRIHPATGTAAEGALIAVEGLFKSGEITAWRGDINFPAENEAGAADLKNRVMAGLRWITAIGSEKSVGFGRLVAVEEQGWQPEETAPVPQPKELSKSVAPRRGLTLLAAEPLTIGSVRIKNNYLETGDVITGAAIKGALAQCIRRRVNLSDDKLIEPCEKLNSAGLSTLARHFEAIRFTHAFPSPCEGKRPVVFPLSLVNEGKADVALMAGPGLVGGRAPAFSIDWKDHSAVTADYGWTHPRTIATTRTAIHEETRRSNAEQLYTFEAMCPTDGSGRQVYWAGDVVFPPAIPAAEAVKLEHELEWVVNHWFDRIGKRGGRLKRADLLREPNRPAIAESDCVRDGHCIVTLQSDALMLDPWTLQDGDRQTLRRAYADYWDAVSGGALTLVRHLATQKLLGGYLGRRFKPMGEERYFPFFLTGAGAVFVLKAEDADFAGRLCDKWETGGLPAPVWAKDVRYGKTAEGRLDWGRCPFTPENGFGEIAINLPCHWDLQAG